MGIRDAIGEQIASVGEAIKTPDASPPAVTPIKAPWWVILLTIVGAIVLAVAGALVLREGRETWNDPDLPQVASTPTKKTTKVVRTRAKTGSRARTTTRENSIERPSQAGGRSEPLALATLATGAALLLAGGFAARLTSIKLPGGVELAVAEAWNSGAKAGAASTAKAAVVAKDQGKDEVLGDDQKLALAGMKTLHARIEASAVSAAAAGGTPTLAIDDQQLREAAEAAVEEIAD